MAYIPDYIVDKECIANKVNKESLSILKKYFTKTTIIVCIGTDLIIGDCLGPLVGTFLKERNFPLFVFGTLENPVHAQNIDSKIDIIKKLHPSSKIIAVDACICSKDSIGHIMISERPVYPGKGLGKVLPSVGDISILGGTYNKSNSNSFLNSKIHLSFIVKLAYVIAYIIEDCYEQYSKDESTSPLLELKE